MIQVKMSEGGRVVIPAKIRHAMAIKDGDAVLWELRDGVAQLTTRDQRLRHAQALIKGVGSADECWSDELIAERRAEAMRD